MADADTVRADQWLWAARFFRTRHLARLAIDGGKVELNGARCKPAKAVRIGDRVRVRRGEDLSEVEVLGLAVLRGPATVARTLYAETEASVRAREERLAIARLQPGAGPEHRPGKSARRDLRRLKRGQS